MVAKKLLVINFIAITATVFHHATHWVLISLFYWWPERLGKTFNPDSGYGLVVFNLLRVFDALAIIAVPLLLFVSGFAVTKMIADLPTLKSNYRTALTRARNILIPYLVWSFLWLIYRMLTGETFTAQEIGMLLLLGRAANEYYFIPILIQLYLLAPLLVGLTRRKPWIILGLAVVLNLVARLPFYLYQLTDLPRTAGLNVLMDWHLPTYLLWYVCGLIFGIKTQTIYAWIQSRRRIILAAALVAWLAVVVEIIWLGGQVGKAWIYGNGALTSQILSILVIVMMLGLDYTKLPYQDHIRRFSSQSLGIYLVHSIILVIVGKAVYHLLPHLFLAPMLFHLVLGAAGVIVPLLAMRFFAFRPFKRFYFVLFG